MQNIHQQKIIHHQNGSRKKMLELSALSNELMVMVRVKF